MKRKSRRKVVEVSDESGSEFEGDPGRLSYSSESDGGVQEVSRSSHSSTTSSRDQSLENNKKSPTYEGLKTLRTRNKLFPDLRNYRFYRINDNAQGRSARANFSVRDFGDKQNWFWF